MKLAGWTVLITGASQGVGAATARAIATRGAEVVLLAHPATHSTPDAGTARV